MHTQGFFFQWLAYNSTFFIVGHEKEQQLPKQDLGPCCTVFCNMNDLHESYFKDAKILNLNWF